MRTTLIIIGSLIVTILLVFLIGYTDVFYTHTVGKAKKNADREVYKESQPYNDGMAQELSKLKAEYEKAPDEQSRNAIESVIRHDYADFDETNLQSEGLRTWLVNMRGF